MATMPPSVRIFSWRSYLETEWEFLLISLFCAVGGLMLMIFLATREFLEMETAEPERYARISLGEGPSDQPPGEAAAAKGEIIGKPQPVSPRKQAERVESAAVSKGQVARNRALQQSLVGVIASRSTGPSTALSRVFSQTGIGSEVDRALQRVDKTGVGQVGGTGPTALQSRGGAGIGKGGGAGGVGLGGLGGLGTGYGGGGGEGVNLGLKSTQQVTASLTKGRASIEGSLDAGIIDQVVKKNLSALKYCYEKELNAKPKLQGKILVQFVIGLSGEVVDVKIESSSLADAEVEDCVSRRVRRWRFPRPEGGTVLVSYPFVFTTGS